MVKKRAFHTNSKTTYSRYSEISRITRGEPNLNNHKIISTKDLEVENKLNKEGLDMLNKGVWPMSDPKLKNEISEHILKQQENLALYSVHEFKENERVNDEARNIASEKWSPIKWETKRRVESLIWRIFSVEILSKNNGSMTAGVDNIKFLSIERKVETIEDAFRVLKNKIKKIKIELSLARGKTDQVIRRKKLKQKRLSARDERRRWLKNTSEGINYRKNLKTIYKKMIENPIKFVKEQRESTIKHNVQLKFKLLMAIKPLRLKRYKSDNIKRVMIPKENGKERALGIPTLRDRAVQMLIKICIEPCLEPLGDNNSFGFRIGRGCHMAVSRLGNFTIYRKRGGTDRLRMKTFKDLRKNKINKNFYNTQYILDADIKGCFDNINHDWLLKNIPMPKGYEKILEKLLKVNIEYNGLIIKSTQGIPQGGIISPILMNWTLDGLENRIYDTVKLTRLSNTSRRGYFYSKDKERWMLKNFNMGEYKEIDELTPRLQKNKFQSKGYAWFVRYADDIVIGCNSLDYMNLIKTRISEFLSLRGLELSNEKSRIIKWTFNKKFDFLGWTFHLIRPNKINWIIKAPKSRKGKLSDWVGLYIYPSKKSTLEFRKKVKKITSLSNSSVPMESIIKQLRTLILGWSNYYSPGGKLHMLRATLDWYVWRRCKKFLMKKYGTKGFGPAVSRLLNKNGKVSTLHIGPLEVPRLTNLAADAPWTLLKPSNILLNNSFLVNKEGYIKRKLIIMKLKDELKSKLYFKQKQLCPLCNENLVNWNKMGNNLEMTSLYFESNKDIDIAEIIDEQNINDRQGFTLSESHAINNQEKLDISSQRDWSTNLDFDHIIPKGVSRYDKTLKSIFDSYENTQLVHKRCHKLKSNQDREIMKKLRKVLVLEIKEQVAEESIIKPQIKNKKKAKSIDKIIDKKECVSDIILTFLSNNEILKERNYKVLKHILKQIEIKLMENNITDSNSINNKVKSKNKFKRSRRLNKKLVLDLRSIRKNVAG